MPSGPHSTARERVMWDPLTLPHARGEEVAYLAPERIGIGPPSPPLFITESAVVLRRLFWGCGMPKQESQLAEDARSKPPGASPV